MSVLLVVSTASVNYSADQALSDLAQIAPIAAVAVAMIVAMVVDLILPARRRAVRPGGDSQSLRRRLGHIRRGPEPGWSHGHRHRHQVWHVHLLG